VREPIPFDTAGAAKPRPVPTCPDLADCVAIESAGWTVSVAVAEAVAADPDVGAAEAR
jgi:hypothetical protein